MKTFLTLRKTLALTVAAIAFILSANLVQAQGRQEVEGSKTKFMVGVKGGFSIYDFRNGSDADYFVRLRGMGKTSNGTALAFARYNMTDWVNVDLEAGWSQSGCYNSLSDASGTLTGSARYTLNNVQTNLVFGFKLPVLSVYEPRFIIGPSFDFNVHATEYRSGATNATGIGSSVTVKRRIDVTDDFKPMDIGLVVGGQVMFDIDFANLLIDARYRHGMSNINNNMTSRNLLGQPGVLQTSGLSFMVGLGFPL